MGDIFSTPSQPNSTSSPTATAAHTMSSPNPLQPQEPNPTDQPKTQEPTAKIGDKPIQESPDAEEEEEEEGECGFCLFMKGGGCKDTFVEWEKCVEEGEKNKEDIVDKCFQATAALKKCMEAHSDYYAPLLEAEKAAEEEAAKHLEISDSGGEELGGNLGGSADQEEDS